MPNPLEPSQNTGYLSWELPSPRDYEIRDFLHALVTQQAVHEPRGQSGTTITEGEGLVLLVFAERMASLAVRHHDESLLQAGLSAARVACQAVDPREVILILPLLWRSAEYLQVDPVETFTSTSTVFPTFDCPAIASFPSRPPEKRSLKSMGYTELHSEQGLIYQRTW